MRHHVSLTIFLSFVNISTDLSSTSISSDLERFNVVDTPLGRLRGWTASSREGREYSAFTKIPYAEPPVGALRFKNPVPYGKWEGEMLAVEDNPACLQIDRFERTRSPKLAVRGTEDCLYLNVYVPKNATKSLPVLFRIHGGAFQLGHSGPRRMADFVMDENVILVTVSYRVNVFGFLSLETDEIPGNFGLKDTALALKWVNENIQSFGGDPNRLVVFGTSSGGSIAHHLLLSPLTKDMISGAMSNSGSITSIRSLGPPGTVRAKSLEFVRNVGCLTNDPLDCLQSLDAITLLGEYNKTEFWGVQFKPCVEPDAPGAVIPVDPRWLSSKSPWIASFDNGEYTFDYAINQDLDETTDLETIFGPNPGFRTTLSLDQDKWDKIRARYFRNENNMDYRRTVAQISADIVMIYPTLDALNRHQGIKYFYMFEHRGQPTIVDTVPNLKVNVTEAGHGEEVLYNMNMTPELNNSNQNALDRKVSKEFIKLLVNFAHYQNPTPNNSSIQWKPWTKNEMLRITSNGNFMAELQDYQKINEIYQFWKSILS